MPTLVRWPGSIPAQSINSTPSQFHDWLPTFSAMAGVPTPALSDGVSLLPYLTGQGEARESTVYIEYVNNRNTPQYDEFDPHHRGRVRQQMQVVFVDGYKGIRTGIKSHNDDFMIFDLENDPRERMNLSGTNPYFSKLQQRMKDRVLQIRRPNETAPRPYDDAPVPAVSEKKTNSQISWTAYEGDFPWVPQTADLQPSKSGQSSKVDAGVAASATIIEYRGIINAEATDTYTFKVDSDGGAILRLHDAVVVDNESVIDGDRATQGTILLEKGLHPFTLTYRKGSQRNPSLTFSYSR